MTALFAFLKFMLMIIGGLATFGMLLLVLLALRTSNPKGQPRAVAHADFNALVSRRRETFGPIFEEEDDILYAIGCAKVLGDEDTALRLTSMFTDSIQRKTQP